MKNASKRSRGFFLKTVLTCAVSVAAPVAFAIDVDSGDWVAPKPGVNLFLFYLQHSSQDTQYASGDVALRDARLDASVMLLRYARPIEIGGFTVNPQFVLPVGRLSGGGALSALGDETGVGDLMLTAPVWLVNEPEKRRYLAIAPYVFAPIGSYDENDPLNMGENRWKTAIQAGYSTGIGKDFSIELTADATFFGKNDKFTTARLDLEQDTLYQLQGYLNWHQSPTMTYAVGLSRKFGGQSEVAGIDQADRQATTKFLLTASRFFSPTSQWMASVGQDIEVENGGKERFRVNFRYLKVF